MGLRVTPTLVHGETWWNQLKVSHQGSTGMDTHTHTYNSICGPYTCIKYPLDLTRVSETKPTKANF